MGFYFFILFGFFYGENAINKLWSLQRNVRKPRKTALVDKELESEAWETRIPTFYLTLYLCILYSRQGFICRGIKYIQVYGITGNSFL